MSFKAKQKKRKPAICKNFTKILDDSPGYLLEPMPYKNKLRQLHDHMVSDRKNVRFSLYTDREMNDIIKLLRMYDDKILKNDITNLTPREFRFRLIVLNQTFSQVRQKRQIHNLIQSKRNKLVNEKLKIISELSVEERRRWCFQNPMQDSYRLSDVNRRRQENLRD